MAGRNTQNKVLKAWYEMLNGNISVNVYRTDAEASDHENYVLLRMESETEDHNSVHFVTNPVLITEVVTKFRTRIDDGLSAEIDDEIAQLLFPSSPGKHGLPLQDGIQITDVRRQNATVLPEDDGTKRINRLITRNLHRVVQNDSTEGAGIGSMFIVS